MLVLNLIKVVDVSLSKLPELDGANTWKCVGYGSGMQYGVRDEMWIMCAYMYNVYHSSYCIYHTVWMSKKN